MDAERRLVLFEGGMGAAWLALGAAQAGPDGLRAGWWLGLVAVVGTVGSTYAIEHDLVPTNVFARYTFTVVGVLLSVLAAATVTLVTALSPLTVVSVALAGMGLGLLGYRAVFGLLRPVPESRRATPRRPV
jgi:hypothetical protein